MTKPEEIRRVLLVEDDPAQLALMARWLEGIDNLEVRRVPRAEQAWRMLTDRSRWDLVISDIHLPGMDGLDLLRKFRKREPSTPFLLVTAYKEFDDALEALRNGASGFLTKPLDRSELVDKVSTLLNARHEAPRQESVLVVGARPEDPIIGCGALLLAHTYKGDRVVVAALTTDQEGKHSPRVLQARRGCRALGAEFLVLDLPAGRLREADVVEVLRRLLDATKPTVLYTNSDHDEQEDQRIVHRATLRAAHDVPRLFAYQATTSTVDFRPTLFVDVERRLEEKAAIVGDNAALGVDAEQVRATARYWARFSPHTYTEPLEALHSIA